MTSIATSNRRGAMAQGCDLTIKDHILHRKRIPQNLHVASYGYLRHPTSPLLESHIVRTGYLQGAHHTRNLSTHYLTQPFADISLQSQASSLSFNHYVGLHFPSHKRRPPQSRIRDISKERWQCTVGFKCLSNEGTQIHAFPTHLIPCPPFPFDSAMSTSTCPTKRCRPLILTSFSL